MLGGILLQFLSDNGSAYIAYETQCMARSLGLTPVNTPVGSAQRNGIAGSFVNTFTRDYVKRLDLSDAHTVLAQPPVAFGHVHEVHLHSSLKTKSPREFGRQWAGLLRRAQLGQPALDTYRLCPEMQWQKITRCSKGQFMGWGERIP